MIFGRKKTVNYAKKYGKSPDPWRMNKNRDIDALIWMLDDDDVHNRRNSIVYLGQIGDPRAVEPLIAKLDDETWSHRSYAAEALGQIGDPRAVEPLIRLLNDPCYAVRDSAAKGLGAIPDVRAVEPLIQILGESETLNAVAGAFNALKYHVAFLGNAAIDPLIQALDDDDVEIQIRAAGILRDMRVTGAIEPLIKKLGSPYPRVVNSASSALVEIGPDAIEPLTRALSDHDENISRNASETLERAKTGPPSGKLYSWKYS